MGTVTGRILVSNPSLQQIRRRYRGVIGVPPEMKLAYLDFAQFEPGILASLSGDGAFLERYNAGDIYSELAESMFGDVGMRDVAKRMFLSFTYGMSLDRIVSILGGDDQSERLELFERFVSHFPGVLKFRAEKEGALQSDGFVATAMGNRRYRTGVGPLRHNERRWAVSQAVQGTASLVFKEAVIGIANDLGRDAILLPMHDAVLMQLSSGTYERDVDRARQIMLSALKRRCPDVEGRVVISEHF